jgi:protein O-mannosyl-transferase
MNCRNRPTSSAISPLPEREPPNPARPFGRWDWLFVAALLSAVIVVYRPAWQGGAVWDDDQHLTRPDLRSWQGLGRIWFDLKAAQQYYPLLHSAFWIEHKLWGDVTLGYHLVNILLHATAALLAALILRRLKIPGAYLAAAIFALHPIQVESVAWITEQKNTLSAVFYLGAMLTYLRFDQTRKTPLYFGALGLFVPGLLTKTVTATLPAALLVIFWWQRGRLSWRRDVLPLLPFFAIGAAAGTFTAWVERKLIGAEGAAFDLTLVERCLIAGRAIWFYLGKLLWPGKLLFIYPRWQISQTVWWQYLFPLAAVLLLIALWALRRQWRGPLAGLLYFVGTLFPVLGFFNVFPFIYSFVADHFQYLAGLGIITLVSAAAALLLNRRGLWNRPAGYAVGVIVLAILASLTWRQSRMYADAETLYRTTIAENSGCWMAHNNLGLVLAGQGRTDEAIASYRNALEVKPDHAYACNNLGIALSRSGRGDEAIDQFQRALTINPNLVTPHENLGVALCGQGRFAEAIDHFRKAAEIQPDYVRVRVCLARALVQSGRTDEAIVECRKTLALDPNVLEVYGNLARMLADRGQFDEAIGLLGKALEIAPDQPDARYNLGFLLYQQGRLPEATGQWSELLRLHAEDTRALNQLAWVLATAPAASDRDGAKAVEMAQRAIEFSGGQNPNYLDTLAAAQAEAGRFAEAVETAEKALELATQQNQHTMVESIKVKIPLYQAGTPFRESPSSPTMAPTRP